MANIRLLITRMSVAGDVDEYSSYMKSAANLQALSFGDQHAVLHGYFLLHRDINIVAFLTRGIKYDIEIEDLEAP